MVWPTEEDIRTLASRKVGVAHCPQSNMKIAAGAAPVPQMLRAGVAVGLGTDGAASNNDLNLWEEIDTAAKLHKLVSKDPTVITAREALEMATIRGARAIHLDKESARLRRQARRPNNRERNFGSSDSRIRRLLEARLLDKSFVMSKP